MRTLECSRVHFTCRFVPVRIFPSTTVMESQNLEPQSELPSSVAYHNCSPCPMDMKEGVSPFSLFETNPIICTIYIYIIHPVYEYLYLYIYVYMYVCK